MNKRKAFTIVELLIVLVIIALLVSILLPSFAMIRRMAKETAQRAQFATMDMAMDSFKQDYGDYPPSNFQDGAPTGFVYCGAQKLTEALLGWDLKGFDPNTAWRHDGYSGLGVPIGGPDSYDPQIKRLTPTGQPATLFERRGPYLEVAKTSVYRLGISGAGKNDGLYDLTGNTNFDSTQQNYVICDVFGIKKITVTQPAPSTQSFIYTAGTPILYYKANTNNKFLDCTVLGTQNSIYDYRDNQALLNLKVLPKATQPHKLSLTVIPAGVYFCDPQYKIVDEKVPLFNGKYWPHRPDTYLLISAGMDHEFGTNDDILNF